MNIEIEITNEQKEKLQKRVAEINRNRGTTFTVESYLKARFEKAIEINAPILQF